MSSSIMPPGLDTSLIPLTEAQSQALSLLSELEDTRIRLALLASLDLQSSVEAAEQQQEHDAGEEDITAQLKQAEHALLDSRAQYTLRNRIIRHALIADPILQAVHSSAHVQAPHAHVQESKNRSHGDPNADTDAPSTLLLSHLRRAIHTRDVLNMLHAETSTQVAVAEQGATKTERETKRINEQSAQLAARMVGLALEVREESTETVQDDQTRIHLLAVDRDVAAAKKEWRQLKSFLATIIVASGVDWAADPSLVELVMDEEDDGP